MREPRDIVLVTGVGGGVGQSILKSLTGSRYTCVAIDADHLAMGLYAAPIAYRGAQASAPELIERFLEVCMLEECALVFPGLDTELLSLAVNIDRFLDSGVQPVVSSPDVIRICDDKLETASFLQTHGFAAPATAPLLTAPLDEFPLVLKPQQGGTGSHNVFVIDSPNQLEIALTQVDQANCVVQEYIDGDEYTCGTVNMGNMCHGVILMRRTLRAGDTYKAFVVRDPAIETYVGEVADTLQPLGACNFQLRVRDGDPYIFEINARCSGTTHARSLAGFNEPRMIADYLLHGKEPKFEIRETVTLRYWQELLVPEEKLATLVREGRVENEDVDL
jgi:carbamoyl-phosphate synthase large subunit